MIDFKGEIGHLEGIESPWGNAGGVVKTVEDVELMAHTGVGWIEAGSYTLEPRLGNAWNPETGQFDRTVYFHNSEIGETFNSLGMPNKGMDVVETEIPEMAKIAHAHNKPLVVNVAPVTGQPEMEALELVRRAYEAGADAVLLNAGCPNVLSADGGRHEILSHSPDNLEIVLNGLKSVVQTHSPIFLRLSPYVDYASMVRAKMAITTDWNRGTVSTIFTPNTWGGHKPVKENGEPILDVPGNVGGKSGPAISDLASQQTEWAVSMFSREGFNIDVVSSSGIMRASQIQKRLALGAVAAAGTTFFYESKSGWKDDTDRLLSELAA